MKYAIFGYGSLVNKSSLEKTLGRKVDKLYPSVLEGWVRDWSIIINNHEGDKYFTLLLSNERPENVAVLNVRQSTDGQATNPNGILCACTLEELVYLDEREVHYKRVDVTKYISNTHSFDRIFTYVGLSQYLPQKSTTAVIPSSYIELVREGFTDINKRFYEQYINSTIDSPYRVVKTKFITT